MYKIIHIYFSQNICIRQEEGNCCIRYNLCSDTNSWAISYNTGTIAIATSSGSLCALDYVNISGVTETCDQAHNQPLFNKICGYAFGLGHNLPLAQASAHVCGKYNENSNKPPLFWNFLKTLFHTDHRRRWFIGTDTVF